MKKILLLLVLSFLLTGCDINYNLNIDEAFEENISVVEGNSNNWNYTITGMTMKDFNDYFLVKEIPYHYDDDYVPEDFVRLPNVSYYDVEDLSDASRIGLSLHSKFKNLDSFSGSKMVWTACTNKNIKKNDDSISIVASKFKVFEEYKTLDKLTVNIKSKYVVISNNADSVKDNIYTWVITRDNYLDKSINISLKTSSLLDDAIKKSSDDPMINFAIVLLALFTAFFIIYKILMSIFKKNNSF